MKILHVPFQYHPEPPGGTEVYVTSLAAGLRARGHEATIAAQATTNRAFIHEGTPARLYAVSPSLSLADSWGEGDPIAARNFSALLDAEPPDVLHLHACTAAAFLLPLREAKRRGIPVVYTWHHPGTSCPRSTLLRWGQEICDGTLEVGRCAACTLQSHGLPRVLAHAAALSPTRLANAAARFLPPGDLGTVLQTRVLTRRFQGRFDSFMREVDRIVILSEWILPVLERNGVDPGKVLISPQALPSGERFIDLPEPPDPSMRPLHLLFLGRLDPSKGIDRVIDAIHAMPSAPVVLDIYGAPVVADYVQGLMRRASADARIRIHPPLPTAEVPAVLRSSHLLVVPSVCLEVAPLVVLESFAAGTPVLSSDRGGTRAMVRDGIDGLVVPGAASDGYRAALTRLLDEPDLLGRLRAGVTSPRPFDGVVESMLALYVDVLRSAAGKREPSTRLLECES